MLRPALLVLALICFVLAALQVPTSGRLNLTALGLAFWMFSQLV